MRIADISFCKTFSLDNDYNFTGHTHNTFEVNIILGGNMKLSVEEKVIILSSGDMIFWLPNLFHYNRVGTDNFTNLLSIHCELEDFPFSDEKIVYYHLDSQKMMLVNIFINEMQRNGFGNDSPVVPLLEALIKMGFNSAKSPIYSEDSSAKVYKKTMDILNDNIDKMYTIPELARICGVCNTTLKNSFSSHSGMSIKKYYIGLKLNTAKNMLLSGMQVNEVARSLGFSSTSYFSQFFKKQTNMGSKEWILANGRELKYN